MERGNIQRDHREYEDMLAAGALGVLTASEHAALRDHLRTCASCRSTFGALIAVADAIPLQVEERAPSPELRQRLLDQIRPEAVAMRTDHRNPGLAAVVSPVDRQGLVPPTPLAQPRKQTTVKWAMWGALAAAMLILAVLSGIVLDRLVLREDEPQVETIALQYPEGLQLDEARLTWSDDDQLLRFTAPDLPELPGGEVYQVWLIEGDEPRPVGVVDSETRAFVATVDRDRIGTFAVTIEPGPIGSAGPTTSPIIVGTLSGDA
jgi:anti-sigma-K factor RskA